MSALETNRSYIVAPGPKALHFNIQGLPMFRSSCTALALLASVITPAVRAADLLLDTAAIESADTA